MSTPVSQLSWPVGGEGEDDGGVGRVHTTSNNQLIMNDSLRSKWAAWNEFCSFCFTEEKNNDEEGFHDDYKGWKTGEIALFYFATRKWTCLSIIISRIVKTICTFSITFSTKVIFYHSKAELLLFNLLLQRNWNSLHGAVLRNAHSLRWVHSLFTTLTRTI